MSLPNQMNGVQITGYGPSNEVLKYRTDIPLPTIKNPYEVLVRVKATGLNPVEAKITAGNAKLISSFKLSFPSIIGADFAGFVAEKGDSVTEFEVGDEVFGSLSLPFGLEGTYAQYAIADVRTSSIAKKPAGVSFEQAASAGIALLTAYQATHNHAEITEENKNIKRNYLVVGASGGIGSFGIQVAKAINPENHVVGICSGKNKEFVKSLGADEVIDYKDEKEYKAFLEKEKENFDLIFDCVGGDAYYQKLSPLIKKNGVYSTAVGPIENFGSSPVSLLGSVSILPKILYRRYFTCHKYLMVLKLPHEEFRNNIAPLMNGKIKGTVVDQESVFALKDADKAHEKLQSHRSVGKIVLSIE